MHHRPIVDQDFRHSKIATDGLHGGIYLRFVGHIALVPLRACEFALQGSKTLAGASEHRNIVSILREPTRDGGTRSGPDSGHYSDWFVRTHPFFSRFCEYSSPLLVISFAT